MEHKSTGNYQESKKSRSNIRDRSTFLHEDAEKYGVVPAVLLYNIRYWVLHNEDNKKNFHEGKYWMYNTLPAFELQFPFLSYDQIRGALETLVKKKAIATGNFNATSYDRTKWYTIEITHVVNSPDASGEIPRSNMPKPQMEVGESPDGIGEIPRCIYKDSYNKQMKPDKKIGHLMAVPPVPDENPALDIQHEIFNQFKSILTGYCVIPRDFIKHLKTSDAKSKLYEVFLDASKEFPLSDSWADIFKYIKWQFQHDDFWASRKNKHSFNWLFKRREKGNGAFNYVYYAELAEANKGQLESPAELCARMEAEELQKLRMAGIIK